MSNLDLGSCAEHNRMTFDEVLGPYVATKLGQTIPSRPRGMRVGWFDASGCVWCVFDDERFLRSGDAGRRLRDEQGEACTLQVYWSMEDVVMPGACGTRWVAERIAEEAIHQLSSRGYCCATEERVAEGETHLGVRFRDIIHPQLKG